MYDRQVVFFTPLSIFVLLSKVGYVSTQRKLHVAELSFFFCCHFLSLFSTTTTTNPNPGLIYNLLTLTLICVWQMTEDTVPTLKLSLGLHGLQACHAEASTWHFWTVCPISALTPPVVEEPVIPKLSRSVFPPVLLIRFSHPPVHMLPTLSLVYCAFLLPPYPEFLFACSNLSVLFYFSLPACLLPNAAANQNQVNSVSTLCLCVCTPVKSC